MVVKLVVDNSPPKDTRTYEERRLAIERDRKKTPAQKVDLIRLLDQEFRNKD